MPNPKRQHSKQRSRKRGTHYKIAENFGDLSTTGSTMGHNHRVDPITGMYKGQQIVAIKVKAKVEKEEKG
ncbi:MAG: 50S ribosomal protein L32 [Candidatus Omnitrophica bacterium]|nr:50S ribosomal protein L32 [Candidatus Omnitrophota bacterium]